MVFFVASYPSEAGERGEGRKDNTVVALEKIDVFFDPKLILDMRKEKYLNLADAVTVTFPGKKKSHGEERIVGTLGIHT